MFVALNLNANSLRVFKLKKEKNERWLRFLYIITRIRTILWNSMFSRVMVDDMHWINNQKCVNNFPVEMNTLVVPSMVLFLATVVADLVVFAFFVDIPSLRCSLHFHSFGNAENKFSTFMSWRCTSQGEYVFSFVFVLIFFSLFSLSLCM